MLRQTVPPKPSPSWEHTALLQDQLRQVALHHCSLVQKVRKQNKRDLITVPVSPHYKVTARCDDTLFVLWEDGTEGLSALLGRTNWKEETCRSNLQVCDQNVEVKEDLAVYFS